MEVKDPTDLSIKIQIWYHADCDDGFGAAWAARKFFEEQGRLHECVFVPVKYGKPHPQFAAHQIIYIVDFSYSKEILSGIRQVAHALYILDHHKSAELELKGFPDAIFDMNRSGAAITWDYFHNKPMPMLLKYVQANDLWRHKSMPHCQAMVRYIRTVKRTFDNWSVLADVMESRYAEVITAAQAIESYFQTQKDYIADAAHFCNFGGHIVPVVNSNYVFCSEVCHTLLDRHKTAFAMSWFVNDEGMAVVSLRSMEYQKIEQIAEAEIVEDNILFDVSVLAKSYGGGGHAKAAGFSMPVTEWLRVVYAPLHFKDAQEAKKYGKLGKNPDQG